MICGRGCFVVVVVGGGAGGVWNGSDDDDWGAKAGWRLARRLGSGEGEGWGCGGKEERVRGVVFVVGGAPVWEYMGVVVPENERYGCGMECGFCWRRDLRCEREMFSLSFRSRSAGCWSRGALDRLVRRRGADEGLLRGRLSCWASRFEEEVRRGGKEVSTSSSIGESTRGELSKGLELLRRKARTEGVDAWEERNLGRGGRYCSLRLWVLLRDVCEEDRSMPFARDVWEGVLSIALSRVNLCTVGLDCCVFGCLWNGFLA